MTKESKGEDVLKDPNVIKMIIDYSQFKLMKMIMFRVVDLQEEKFVEPMIQLAFTFIMTCQQFSKSFKYPIPSFQFTYNDIHEGISVALVFDDDHVKEEDCKKYITNTFSPEAKILIENLFQNENKKVNEDIKVN